MLNSINPDLLIAIAILLGGVAFWAYSKDRTKGGLVGLLALVITILAIVVQHVDTLRQENYAKAATPKSPSPLVSTSGTTKTARPKVKPKPSPDATPSRTLQRRATKPSVTPTPEKTRPDPEVTRLPADSPLRERGPSPEDACTLLGYDMEGRYAWLPGQESSTSIEGREVEAPGAAFTWSCTRGGRKLTRDDFSQACHMEWGPDTKAYTTDPDDAYTWICI